MTSIFSQARGDLKALHRSATIPFTITATAQVWQRGFAGLATIRAIGGSDATTITLRDGGAGGTVIGSVSLGIGQNIRLGTFRFIDGLHITVTGTDPVIFGAGSPAGIDSSVFASTVTISTPVGGGSLPGSPLLFLDARSLESQGYSDTDAMTSGWADDSGNSHDFLGTGATSPVYKATGLNSGPCADFSGGNLFLNGKTGPDDFLDGLSSAELFIVLQVNENSGVIRGGWYFNNCNFPTHYPYSDGVIYESFGTGTRVTASDPTTDLTAPHIYHVAAVPGTNNWLIEVGSENIFTGTATFSGNAGIQLRIGRNDDADYLEGQIAAVVVYGETLSAADRTAVKTFLTNAFLT